MNRTALRLATLAALTDGGNSPYPTLARDNVYDSRRDPLRDVEERMRRPVIVIRTDEDVRDNRGPNGMVTERQARTVELLLELSVVTASKETDEQGQEQWVLWWPQTDAALEATLDMLEYQVENALFGLSEWAQWWQTRKWVRTTMASRPEFSRDPSAVRLAARTISFTMLLPRECLPGWRFEDEIALPGAPPPLLQSILDKLIEDGGADLRAAAQEIELVLDARGWPQESAHPQFLRAPTILYSSGTGRQFVETDLRAGLHKLHHSTRYNSLYWLLFADEMWFARHWSLDFVEHVNSHYIPLILEDI